MTIDFNLVSIILKSVSFTRSQHIVVRARRIMAKLTNGTEENGTQAYQEYLDLIHATANTSSPSSISPDQLAGRLGINGLPSGEEAIKLLETEILAPVRNLSGSDLSKWQM